MVSRLGCLFSELVPSVSLWFTCKSSFWNKGREPSVKESLVTPPQREGSLFPRDSELTQNPTNRHPPARLEKQAWMLQHHLQSGHCLTALAHPSPTPSIGSDDQRHCAGTAQGSRLSQHSPDLNFTGCGKTRRLWKIWFREWRVFEKKNNYKSERLLYYSTDTVYVSPIFSIGIFTLETVWSNREAA